MRKLLCWMFGHRSIRLFSYRWDRGTPHDCSELTGWKCERCENQFYKQWDHA